MDQVRQRDARRRLARKKWLGFVSNENGINASQYPSATACCLSCLFKEEKGARFPWWKTGSKIWGL
jgi:hypothetical protein